MGWLLRIYVGLHRLDRWVERRFTPLGRLALGGTVIAALFALDTRRTQAYQLFAILAALLLVSFLASLRRPPDVRLQRRLPGFATAGQPFRYVMLLAPGDGPARPWAWLSDRLATTWPSARDLRSAAHREGRRQVWFSYRNWLRWLRRARGAEVDAVDLSEGHGGGGEPGAATPAQVTLRLRPLRRGYVHFAGVEVGVTDPLGLCRAVRRVALGGALLVLPQRRPVHLHWSQAGGRSGALGAGLGRGVGQSDEFRHLREYRPGDPLRHVHWRSWARHGEPMVREFHAPAHQHLAVVLDHYGVQSGEPLFEEAVSVAASLVEAAAAAGAGVELHLADASLRIDARRGERADRLLAALACVEGVAGEGLDGRAAQLLAAPGTASVAMCVLTRWDDARARLLRQLAVAGLSVQVVLVRPVAGGADADAPAAPPVACTVVRVGERGPLALEGRW